MTVSVTERLRTGAEFTVAPGTADDDVLDVTVPVTVADNALAVLGSAPGGTPAELPLPDVVAGVAADLGPVTATVPITVGGNAADVAGLDVAQPGALPPSPDDPDHGDAGAVDLPVLACGNAIAVLGGADAACPPPAGDDGAASARPGASSRPPPARME